MRDNPGMSREWWILKTDNDDRFYDRFAWQISNLSSCHKIYKTRHAYFHRKHITRGPSPGITDKLFSRRNSLQPAEGGKRSVFERSKNIKLLNNRQRVSPPPAYWIKVDPEYDLVNSWGWTLPLPWPHPVLDFSLPWVVFEVDCSQPLLFNPRKKKRATPQPCQFSRFALASSSLAIITPRVQRSNESTRK